jgi:hypothetical protein
VASDQAPERGFQNKNTQNESYIYLKKQNKNAEQGVKVYVKVRHFKCRTYVSTHMSTAAEIQ